MSIVWEVLQDFSQTFANILLKSTHFLFPNNFRVTLNHIQSPWRCRQHITTKRLNEGITLYGVSTQNPIIWINVRWSCSLWSAISSLCENLRIITYGSRSVCYSEPSKRLGFFLQLACETFACNFFAYNSVGSELIIVSKGEKLRVLFLHSFVRLRSHVNWALNWIRLHGEGGGRSWKEVKVGFVLPKLHNAELQSKSVKAENLIKFRPSEVENGTDNDPGRYIKTTLWDIGLYKTYKRVRCLDTSHTWNISTSQIFSLFVSLPVVNFMYVVI